MKKPLTQLFRASKLEFQFADPSCQARKLFHFLKLVLLGELRFLVLNRITANKNTVRGKKAMVNFAQ